jgi:uncharacterized protein YbgA (DUF1722 family)/uncharacterized protein YbbK (DUF523 family)
VVESLEHEAMTTFPRPRVVISRCIDFDACRYNGQVIRASLREELEAWVELVPICPELEIGLGVPRDPIHLVAGSGAGSAGQRLVQPSTGRDLTASMMRFTDDYLSNVGDVDGFILKSRSPSCGAGSAKVHQPDRKGPPSRGSGMFAAGVQERFPGAPIEEETRLGNLLIRDLFLTRLFTLAGFRATAAERSAAALVEFHARNKLLLMGFNQTRMRALGRIVAEQKAGTIGEAMDRYRAELEAALRRAPRIAATVNVLMHAFGHFKKLLTRREKQHFLETLEDYRCRRLSLSAVNALLRSWAARFDASYVAGQSFFEPYPSELVRLEPPRSRGRDVLERA